MTRTLFDCIGDWFEVVVQTNLPGLTKADDEHGTRPDFTSEAFDAEAKAGFWEYGVQLKERQVDRFASNGKPLIYLIGYHAIEGLKKKTKRMHEGDIDQFLQDNAQMHSAYLVSNEVIQKIWKREHRTAASDPGWNYFSVRPRHLDSIINNKPFMRGGVRYMPSKRYELRRSKLLLQPAPNLRGVKSGLQFGTILDREKDEAVIEYMTKRKLI